MGERGGNLNKGSSNGNKWITMLKTLTPLGLIMTSIFLLFVYIVKGLCKGRYHHFTCLTCVTYLCNTSLIVERDEIQKLQTLAAAEEMKLEKAEKYLEEDAVRFDEFLKVNDRNSVEALKHPQADRKRAFNVIVSCLTSLYTSDISKCEEILREYLMYKEFLYRLSPKEWREERERVKQERKRRSVTQSEAKLSISPDITKKAEGRFSVQGAQSRDSTREGRQYSRQSTKAEAKLYFTDPQQLLDIFSELEEQNLSLIQNSQETEESLEEMKQTISTTQEKMERETQQLKEHIDNLKASIAKEEERAAELELKSQIFAFGQYKSEDQEKMLATLSKKVEEVYRACIGENRSNLNVLQMLMAIEHQLGELLDSIELIPPKRLEAAEKAKEKERRLRLREEKIKQQKQHQEERLRKALERAQADPKKPLLAPSRMIMPYTFKGFQISLCL
ncbi:hypothetical protein GDO86_019790 [Hymenochirus boettgeri]|uniref:DUF4200 domain-containing protein n=1 Tax=Hymenochirus boettgeri TaxID=247094 RepID=A0A8T2IL68_9PIPI|nr:hypothetical protein GDO86_019790 [Hymenochirus boettgeri]